MKADKFKDAVYDMMAKCSDSSGCARHELDMHQNEWGRIDYLFVDALHQLVWRVAAETNLEQSPPEYLARLSDVAKARLNAIHEVASMAMTRLCKMKYPQLFKDTPLDHMSIIEKEVV